MSTTVNHTHAPDEGLELWTIYQKPKDYPDGFVVRRSLVGAGRKCLTCESGARHTNTVCPLMDATAQYAPSLETARALVPRGLARIPRNPEDDSVIVEVWL